MKANRRTMKVLPVVIATTALYAATAAQADNALDKLKRRLATLQSQASQSKPPPVANPAHERPMTPDNARDEHERLDGLTAAPAEYEPPKGFERLDVVGVHIGMPAQKAIAVLRAHNPMLNLRTESLKFTSWPNAAAYAIVGQQPGPTAGSLSEEVVLRLALPPLPSVVTESLRVAHYGAGKEPTLDSVLSSLRAKYGDTPVKLAADGHGLRTLYVWRLDGQRVNTGPGGCFYRGAPMNPDQRWSAMKSANDYQGDLLEKYHQELERLGQLCGTVAVAVIATPVRNPQLVSEWLVRVSSEPYRASVSKALIGSLRSAEGKRQDTEVKNAARVKVKS